MEKADPKVGLYRTQNSELSTAPEHEPSTENTEV
jgi:hypothetical protein